jgi:quinol monooxygenase YgiN
LASAQAILRETTSILVSAPDIFLSADSFQSPESSSWCRQRASFGRTPLNTTIAVTKDVTTLINILTVEPQNQQKLIKLLRDSTESVITRLDGWISTSFIAATDQCHVVIYSQWRDVASVEAMRANPEMVAYFPKVAALAAFDSLSGDVVYNRHA